MKLARLLKAPDGWEFKDVVWAMGVVGWGFALVGWVVTVAGALAAGAVWLWMNGRL